MSKVSIVIPVYNVQDYLVECLESVVNQSYANIEIIIINDGSTDGSAIICNDFMRKDERIKFIQQNNLGLCEARNTGLLNATGSYVTFVDSDDSLHTDFINLLVKAIETENADIAECGINTGQSVLIRGQWEGISNDAAFDYKKNYIVSGKGTGYVWNKMYRRGLIDSTKATFSLELLEDYNFNLILFCNAKSFVIISDRLYNYRIRSGSASRVFKPVYFNSLIECMKLKKSLMLELGVNNKCEVKKSNKWFLDNLLNYLDILSYSSAIPYRQKSKLFHDMMNNSFVLDVISQGSKFSIKSELIKSKSFITIYTYSLLKQKTKKLIKK